MLLHLGKVKSRARLQVDTCCLMLTQRIAKLTTAYHFFHMSERIEILTRCRRFHQMFNFDNDEFLNLLLHSFLVFKMPTSPSSLSSP